MSNDEDEESDFVFIDLGEIFNGGTQGDLGDDNLCFENHIHLPRLMRCTCHYLNLVATTDVKNIDNLRLQNGRQVETSVSL